MSFHREIDPSDARGESLDGMPALREQRLGRSSVLATGTLACPACDAPVAPPGPLAVTAPLACPYCAHAGAVRDFLSLAPPSRPARVVVRVISTSGSGLPPPAASGSGSATRWSRRRA